VGGLERRVKFTSPLAGEGGAQRRMGRWAEVPPRLPGRWREAPVGGWGKYSIREMFRVRGLKQHSPLGFE
jgi:hypothetical protein